MSSNIIPIMFKEHFNNEQIVEPFNNEQIVESFGKKKEKKENKKEKKENKKEKKEKKKEKKEKKKEIKIERKASERDIIMSNETDEERVKREEKEENKAEKEDNKKFKKFKPIDELFKLARYFYKHRKWFGGFIFVMFIIYVFNIVAPKSIPDFVKFITGIIGGVFNGTIKILKNLSSKKELSSKKNT